MPKVVLDDDDVGSRSFVHKKWLQSGIAPVRELRTYLGEQMTLYLCWVETLNSTMFLPMIAGLLCMAYGVAIVALEKEDYWLGTPCNGNYYSVLDDDNASTSSTSGSGSGNGPNSGNRTMNAMEALTNNEATPVFAVIICIWCTVFGF
jgi:anoctamin-5